MMMMIMKIIAMNESKDLCNIDLSSGGGRLCTCPLPLTALAGRLPGERNGCSDEGEDGGDGEDGEDDPQGAQFSSEGLHCSHLSTLLHTSMNFVYPKNVEKAQK